MVVPVHDGMLRKNSPHYKPVGTRQLSGVALKRGKPKEAFIVGQLYEMYIPVAKLIELHMGLRFKDSTNYQFKCHSTNGGTFWSRDISYQQVLGGSIPPPAHPDYGMPFTPEVVCSIRLATDE